MMIWAYISSETILPRWTMMTSSWVSSHDTVFMSCQFFQQCFLVPLDLDVPFHEAFVDCALGDVRSKAGVLLPEPCILYLKFPVALFQRLGIGDQPIQLGLV